MSSLSLSRIPRRAQFALLAVLIIAALWFLVLHKVVSSSSSETSAPPAHAPTYVRRTTPPPSAARAHHPAATTTPATARHAAATSPAHRPAASTAHKPATTTHKAAVTTAPKHAASAKHAPAATSTHHAATAHPPASPAVPKSAGALPPPSQVYTQVQAQLAAHKVVLVLFFTPAGTTDQFVAREMLNAAHAFGKGVATYFALPEAVTDFGSFTQKALITETPTIMIISPGGQVGTIAGYTTAGPIAAAIAVAGGKLSAAPAHSRTPKHK